MKIGTPRTQEVKPDQTLWSTSKTGQYLPIGLSHFHSGPVGGGLTSFAAIIPVVPVLVTCQNAQNTQISNHCNDTRETQQSDILKQNNQVRSVLLKKNHPKFTNLQFRVITFSITTYARPNHSSFVSFPKFHLTTDAFKFIPDIIDQIFKLVWHKINVVELLPHRLHQRDVCTY